MKRGEIVAGKYRLDARLGVGGMGEVWRATHTGTGREFALKFMHAHTALSATARERFAREARASSAVNHPAVIDVFDVGEHDDAPYLAMELLDGVALADALHAEPPLSIHELCVVLHDTARALAAAHAAGIIHRDIKPANVFLHKDRATGLASAKILDFGISKFAGMEDQTATGAVLGSPRYMSPEQTRAAAAVDPLADLWACGVILFEGLTGTWPHEGDSYSSLVVAICTTPPRSIDQLAPGVPEPVRAIVRDCLKPLDQRIRSAGELADRLAAVLADPTLASRPLARPAHPSSDPVKVVSGVRIRPLLTTTGSAPTAAALPPLPPLVPPPVRSMAVGALPPPAPLDGTLETLATTTLREPAPRVPVPVSPTSLREGPAAPSNPGRALRITAAALAVLFAGTVVALVSVLRSGLTGGEGTPATGASAVVLSAVPVPSTSAAPADPAPAPSAPAPSASAAPEVKHTKPPPAAPPPRSPPPTGSKVKKLGSGL